ncbi:hypothetical protein R3I94_016757 [Phoxinus phoxinus]
MVQNNCDINKPADILYDIWTGRADPDRREAELHEQTDLGLHRSCVRVITPPNIIKLDPNHKQRVTKEPKDREKERLRFRKLTEQRRYAGDLQGADSLRGARGLQGLV